MGGFRNRFVHPINILSSNWRTFENPGCKGISVAIIYSVYEDNINITEERKTFYYYSNLGRLVRITQEIQ